MNAQPIRLINKSLAPLVFCFLFFLISCTKDQNSNFDCTGLTPTYTADIKQILNASCAKSGCHDAFSHQNGVDLSSYGGASDASRNSSFLGTIEHKSGFNPMPQDANKLSNDKIQLLNCWVQNASPE